MTSLGEYFSTDWSAMTAADWVGLIVTVVTFVLMVGLYFYVFRPKNRERLERHRHIPFEDDGSSGDTR